MLPEDWRLSKLLYNTFSVQSVEPLNIPHHHQQHHRHQSGGGEYGLHLPAGERHPPHPYLDRLSFFHCGHPAPHQPLAVVYKKNSFLSPAARTFMDLIKEYYRQFDRGSALSNSLTAGRSYATLRAIKSYTTDGSGTTTWSIAGGSSAFMPTVWAHGIKPVALFFLKERPTQKRETW